MKKVWNYGMIAALAVSLSVGTISCSSDDDGGTEPPVYELEVVGLGEGNILEVDPADVETKIINLKTNASKEEISIEKVTNQSWCTASLKGTTEIAITSGANTANTDRQAKFKLVAGASSIEFSVIQIGVELAGRTLTIDPSHITYDPTNEYMLYSYMGEPNSDKVISIKVTTNANRWKVSSQDFMGDPVDWIVLKRTSGKTGASVEFSLAANTTGEMRNAYLIISAGDAAPISIVIMQSAMDAATSYKLYRDVKKETVFAKGTTLTVNADNEGYVETLYVETDGGYVALVCEAGTDNEVDSWLDAGGNLEKLLIHVKEKNATGEERKLDVVIWDSGWEQELFRIPVVQKAN